MRARGARSRSRVRRDRTPRCRSRTRPAGGPSRAAALDLPPPAAVGDDPEQELAAREPAAATDPFLQLPPGPVARVRPWRVGTHARGPQRVEIGGDQRLSETCASPAVVVRPRRLHQAGQRHDLHAARRPGIGIGRSSSIASSSATCSRSTSISSSSSRIRLAPARFTPRGQSLHVPQPDDVGLRVAPRVPPRAMRLHQSLLLVDPQRLRMHAGELRRHADDVHGPLVRRPAAIARPSLASRRSPQLTPNRFRGESSSPSRSCFKRSFSCATSFSGTSTRTLASRSP